MLPWPQEHQSQNSSSLEYKVEGIKTLNDSHHQMGSKIGLAHLRWPQERQNQNFLEFKEGEGTTTLNNVHHPVSSKIGPAHLPWPQECQNQNSMESKVEETTTHNDLHH